MTSGTPKIPVMIDDGHPHYEIPAEFKEAKDLDWIAWESHPAVIAHDADAVSKDLVRIARAELGEHLRGRGAMVGFPGFGRRQGQRDR